jgi:hypothetical protein
MALAAVFGSVAVCTQLTPVGLPLAGALVVLAAYLAVRLSPEELAARRTGASHSAGPQSGARVASPAPSPAPQQACAPDVPRVVVA